MIRRFIRNNSFFYPLYAKHILRNKRAIFPTSKTQFHLTGFPRSANTYCRILVDTAFPELVVVSHIHTTASIKLALRHRVPTLILIRDPVSACCSLALKRQEEATSKVIKRLFREYIDYHQYVKLHQTSLAFLQFEDIVNTPECVIHAVANQLGLNLENVNIQETIDTAQRLIKEKADGMPPEGSSLPNETRRHMKDALESNFLAHPLCAHATKLHSEVQQLGHA